MRVSERGLSFPCLRVSYLGGFGGVEGVVRLSRWVSLLSFIGGIIYIVYNLRNLENLWIAGKVLPSSLITSIFLPSTLRLSTAWKDHSGFGTPSSHSLWSWLFTQARRTSSPGTFSFELVCGLRRFELISTFSSIGHISTQWGLSHTFVGAIVIPLSTLLLPLPSRYPL